MFVCFFVSFLAVYFVGMSVSLWSEHGFFLTSQRKEVSASNYSGSKIIHAYEANSYICKSCRLKNRSRGVRVFTIDCIKELV